MGDEGSAIIMDSGSGFTKLGFSGEDEPQSTFPSIIGRPNFQELVAAESKEFYVGNDAYKNRGLLSFRYPIKRATIDLWEDNCKLIKYGFENELRVFRGQEYRRKIRHNLLYLLHLSDLKKVHYASSYGHFIEN